MAALPLVTVITPSFNQARFIEETIKSVVSQDYPRIEYLIMDGGSTDGSVEIIKKYAKKYGFIKYVSEKDRGQADAINKGLKRARGEIVAWLNSDDTYEPHAIRNAVEFMTRNPEYGLVYGEANIINEKGKKTGIFPVTEQLFNPKRLIYVCDYIMQPTTFFRKKVIDDVGHLNENYHWCLDWDLWIRIAKKHPVSYIPFFIANNREYAETKTKAGGLKRLREIRQFLMNTTGMKFTPANFIYSLETYGRCFDALGIAGRMLKRLTINRLIWHFAGRFKYVYNDKWVGRTLECVFFGLKKDILIRGLGKTKLEIVVSVNGEKICCISAHGDGFFKERIKLPKARPGINYLNLVPSRTRRAGIFDSRQVSFRLSEISFDKISRLENPLISIITPSYNQGGFIERTIKSVISQDYPNKECIIIDGGSTDNSVEIIKKYAKKHGFIKWVSEKDNGQADAINKGLRLAKGEVLAYLNSDDTYMPGALEKVFEFFKKHPDEDFVYGKAWQIDKDDRRMSEYPSQETDLKGLFNKCHICQPAAFFRRNVLNEVGYFNDKLHYAMDYDYWIRCSRLFRLNFIKEHLANTRVHSDAKTYRQSYDMHREIMLVNVNNYGKLSSRWTVGFAKAYVKDHLKVRNNIIMYLIMWTVFVYKMIRYNGEIIFNRTRRMSAELVK